jgi:predicted lipid-binding transport protein (Tim44 family)
MPSTSRRRRAFAAACIGLVVALSAVGSAEARRGGSFGSRGYRTYSAPRSTYTAPSYVAPVQRSMTPRTQQPYGAPAYAPRPYGYPQPQRGGFLRNWGGPIVGGLLAAGLFGMLMGHGFGGGFGAGIGLMALVVQLAVIALVIGLVGRLFRRRGEPAFAGASFARAQPEPLAPGGAHQPPPYGQPYPSGPPVHGDRSGDEIGLTPADFDVFERLLHEVQDAFGREDYAALRERTTPEVMSYLAEELSQNAVAGRRNEVRDLRLLQGDLAEAWNEGDRDYATVALRYSAVDIMRDRNTGHAIAGDERPTETTELWTFVRERGGGGPWGGPGPWAGGSDWKLSAIQETQ